MSRGRIIFTTNKQSDRGIMSLVLGIISLLSLLYCLIFSYVREGEVIRERFGAGLILTLIFCIAGELLGVYSRSEADRYKLVPTLGILINGIVLVSLGMILWVGLY